VENYYAIYKKTTVEFTTGTTIRFLRLVARSSGSHLLENSGQLDWSCTKDFFDSVTVGDVISLTATYEKDMV
jgi:hypothetical protein